VLGGLASSGFASNTKRFAAKSGDKNPAPGSYKPVDGIAAKAAKIASKSSDADQAAVQWKRMQTAPSIPARHQSYGFRKSADRGIVPLHNKEPGRRCGGAKSAHITKTTTKAKGVDWSKNTSDRFPAEKEAPPPGPTAYESSSPSRTSHHVPPQRSTHGATYNEMLARKRLEEAANVPGPGSYGVPDPSPFDKAGDSGPSKGVGTKAQGKGFGVTAKRLVPDKEVSIGPGQYEEIRTAIQQKGAHPLATHVTPFGNTASRFVKQASADVPGPGSYIDDPKGGAAMKQLKQRLGKFEGGFGSGSSRFDADGSYVGSTGRDVGPGTYEGGLDPETHEMLENRRHRGLGSTFMSKDSRAKVVSKSLGLSGKEDEPAPGDYVVESNIGGNGRDTNKERPFNTSDERWRVSKTDKTPGPVTYEPEKAKPAAARRDRTGKAVIAQNSFNAAAGRFDEKPAVAGIGHSLRHTTKPGPGQYDDGMVEATTKWRKPTYNITIRRSEMQANPGF